jgi:hypothetical protein
MQQTYKSSTWLNNCSWQIIFLLQVKACGYTSNPNLGYIIELEKIPKPGLKPVS